MQAKSGLDKSPIVCGVAVTVDFVSEEKAMKIISQHRQTPDTLLQDRWLSSPAQSGQTPQTPSRMTNGSQWDSHDLGLQTPGQTLPSSSASSANSAGHHTDTDPAPPTLWSNSGFLPGLTSPWSRQPQTESSLFPSSNNRQELAAMSSSPSFSTYLPNGLL